MTVEEAVGKVKGHALIVVVLVTWLETVLNLNMGVEDLIMVEEEHLDGGQIGIEVDDLIPEAEVGICMVEVVEAVVVGV